MKKYLTSKELRQKNSEQLDKLLSELQEKLRYLRFQITQREVKNNQEMRFLKKYIARIHTILNQKQATPDQA